MKRKANFDDQLAINNALKDAMIKYDDGTFDYKKGYNDVVIAKQASEQVGAEITSNMVHHFRKSRYGQLARRKSIIERKGASSNAGRDRTQRIERKIDALEAGMKLLLEAHGLEIREPRFANNVVKLRSTDHHNKKLSDDQIREIKQLVADGVPTREIAETYGVSKTTVAYVGKGVGRYGKI